MEEPTATLLTIPSAPLSKLFTALSKAQAVIIAAKKDSVNPFYKSTYADMASVWECCRKPLTDNGLCIIQLPYHENKVFGILTILAHESGERIEGFMPLNLNERASPQDIGKAMTYIRRYALSSVVGIAPAGDDDDGNSAQQASKSLPATTSPPATISMEQVATLENRIARTGTILLDVLKFFNVKSLTHMSETQFNIAKEMLDKKDGDMTKVTKVTEMQDDSAKAK